MLKSNIPTEYNPKIYTKLIFTRGAIMIENIQSFCCLWWNDYVSIEAYQPICGIKTLAIITHKSLKSQLRQFPGITCLDDTFREKCTLFAESSGSSEAVSCHTGGSCYKRNLGSILHLILNKFLVIVCSTTFYYDQYFPNTFDYTISYEFTTHSLEAVLYAVRKLHVGQEVFTRR